MPADLPCFGTATSAADKRSRQVVQRRMMTDDGKPPLLPAALFEFGNRVVGLRIAETEIADEFPLRRHVEHRRDRRRIEDRDPAHADALGARGEPDRMHGGDRRILDHFRHGVPAEAVTLRGRAVGEHRKMRRRFFQSGELEPRIEARAVARSARQALAALQTSKLSRIAARARVVLDDDETPRLAQSDRRRQARQLDERFQRASRQRIAAEAPDVAAPDQKIAQAARGTHDRNPSVAPLSPSGLASFVCALMDEA